MRRASPAVRHLTPLALAAFTAVGGWAACARPAVRAHLAAAHAHFAATHAHLAAAHQVMHAAVHHRPAPPRPAAPRPPDDWAECPVMAMNGGSCFGAARAEGVDFAPELTRRQAPQYPRGPDVRDRLPGDRPFHPPRA